MKPLPAAHAASLNPPRTKLITGFGLSLAAHMAIGALITGVSQKTETAAVPIVAIELVDSREQPASAPSNESAAEREGESSVEPAAPPDRPTPAAAPDPIATDVGTIDPAETSPQNAGSASPATLPSGPSLAVTSELPIAAEPTLPEQSQADSARTPGEVADTPPEQPTTLTAMVPPAPIRQPPPRKPPAPAAVPADHPMSIEGPPAGRESVTARRPAESRAGDAPPPASQPHSEMQSGDRSAHPSISPPPRYPMAARRRGQQGRVLLRVTVSPTGAPDDVQLMESSGSAALDDAAKDAVRQWRFHPAVRNGVAIGTRLDVPIRFRLDED